MRHSGARLAICLPQSKEMFEGRGVAFADIEEQPAARRPCASPVAADPFLLLYTSGTTAAPKGVLHAYRTMLGNARLGAPEHGLSRKEPGSLRGAALAPLRPVLAALRVGGRRVHRAAAGFQAGRPGLPRAEPKRRPRCGPRRPTSPRAAPPGVFHKYDWSSLELAIVSGSIAPPSLIHFLAEKLPGCAVTQLWGMTELQAGLYTRPGDPLEMSAHELRAGRARAPKSGCPTRASCRCAGLRCFPATSSNPAESERGVHGRRLVPLRRSRPRRAAGEYFAITGRTKDLINRGGVKFNPAEVEVLLDAHPKILQSAIVPMPDPVLGEKACAFVGPEDARAIAHLQGNWSLTCWRRTSRRTSCPSGW